MIIDLQYYTLKGIINEKCAAIRIYALRTYWSQLDEKCDRDRTISAIKIWGNNIQSKKTETGLSKDDGRTSGSIWDDPL